MTTPTGDRSPRGSAGWPRRAAFDRTRSGIERIETIALRAPLARRFVGSAYSMINRCTIITRLYTADGLVSEVYNGDTDDEQALIVGIIHDELAPRSSVGARPTRRAPGGRWSRRPTTSCATAAWRSRRSRAVDTAIWDVFGEALGLPLHRVWGCGHRQPADQSSSAATTTSTSTRLGDAHGALRRRGLLRGQVQGRRPDARRRTPLRVRAAREAAGPDFALMVDANQGYDRAAGGRVRAARRGPRHPLVRGAVPLDQRPTLDA